MPGIADHLKFENDHLLFTMPYLHDPLRFCLYIEGVSHMRDLPSIWKSSSSLGFAQISLDVWTWATDIPKNVEHVWNVNFMSDTVVLLKDLCESFVLRTLVPDGFNVIQENFLQKKMLKLRQTRLAENLDSFHHQMRQCALFSYQSKRPTVTLAYAPNMLFYYAEKILAFLPPRRTDDGQELLADFSSRGKFLIHIPLDGCAELTNGKNADASMEGSGALAAIKWWHQLKMTVNFASNVGVALEITEDLPTEPYLIDLWRSEPVQTIVLPTKIFLTLDDGTPYLSAAHKILIQSFLQLGNISITLRPGGILTADNFPSMSPYMEHLRGVYHEALTGRPEPVDAVLFPPTQPLRTNLTESEYEHFELDVKKYNDYEAAIRRFIIDRQSQHDVPDIFVAAVVGCGRGPLVTAVLNSALDLNAEIRIYALEKNPLTVGFLEEKCRTSWEGADVRVVMEDMRTWQAPEMLDILLSELLGSFGDNELSPECLAGPEKYLKGTGVSIPARYTSYLCPISSEKIYELFPETERRVREHVYGFDVDYFKILDEPQPVFAFSHPSSEKDPKDRYKMLKFKAQAPGILHGFAGYFVAELFDDIEHNLLPRSRTPGLQTWSKIFFPISVPFLVSKDEPICLHFWRRSDQRAVWYEWALSEPFVSHIHNCGGRACQMSLDFETVG